jgi:hypothetical protein
MDKWNRLKKLYKWKVESFKDNEDPTSLDKYDDLCNKHVLTEMKRIDDNFDYNIKMAGIFVNASNDSIIDYLENIMPIHPEWNLRTHAENIGIRIAQIEDELSNKEF